MVKDTMKRKKPSFNENYHGYRTFSELLEDAQKEGVLELDTDSRSRTYVVTRFGSEMTSRAGAAPPLANKTRKRRRRPPRGKPQGRMLVANKEEANDIPSAADHLNDDIIDTPLRESAPPEASDQKE
jgi:hypothetical protein